MAKRQTRRSISVRGITYQRIQNAIANGRVDGHIDSVSGYLEQLVADDLLRRGEPEPTKVEPKPQKPTTEDTDQIIGQHFTF